MVNTRRQKISFSRSDLRIIFLFVILAFLWGGSFVAIKVVIEDFPPWFAGACRLLVAVLTLYLFMTFRKESVSIPKETILPVWINGLVTVGIPFSFLFWGEQKINAGLAGILNGTTPMWTMLLVATVFSSSRDSGSQLNRKNCTGLILGLVGLVIIFYPRIVFKQTLDEIHGALAVLMMAFSYGLANVLNRNTFNKYPDLKIPAAALHQHFASFLFLVLLAVIFEPLPANETFLKWENILAIVYLGAISSAAAFLIYFYLIKEIGSVKTSTVTYLVPLSALVLDLAILGNIPALSSILGTLAIFLGLFFLKTSGKEVSESDTNHHHSNRG